MQATIQMTTDVGIAEKTEGAAAWLTVSFDEWEELSWFSTQINMRSPTKSRGRMHEITVGEVKRIRRSSARSIFASSSQFKGGPYDTCAGLVATTTEALLILAMPVLDGIGQLHLSVFKIRYYKFMSEFDWHSSKKWP
jgi:hypothetical protein